MIKRTIDKSNPLEYKCTSLVSFPLLDDSISIYLDDLRNPYHIVDACYVTDDPQLVYALIESYDGGEEDSYAVRLDPNTIQYIIDGVTYRAIGVVIPPESVLTQAYDSLGSVLTDYGLDIPAHPDLEVCDLTFLSKEEINHVS